MKLSTLMLLAGSGSVVLSAPAPIVKTVEVQSTQIVTASPTSVANLASNSQSTGTPGGSQAGSSSSESSGWSKWSSLFSQLLGTSSDNNNSGSQDSIQTTLDLSASGKASTKTQNQEAAATSPGNDNILGWLFGSTTTSSTTASPTSSPESSSTSSPSQIVPSSETFSSTASTASTASPSGSSDSDIYAGIYQSPGIDKQFAKDTLDAHNKYRKEHNVGDLSWDVDAYKYAKNVADNYDCSGVLNHTHGPYGENLASGYPSGPAAVKAWYDEGNSYDYSSANTYNHFTQVVWKSTTKVGCAYKNCQWNNWGLYVICSYSPAGNVIGQEAQNVLPEN
ncbi:Piso0_005043 [Millerozyma farinosa CBS 7064]|uniref:Piso0_005043 protein n=1 Tax=Pichia sorbitophila (strain ATCC MYA-4447 / BCRC 22081 / CBS 7064 / NBRC 10061 / NRRL Y-12695) TaxID=559304 RepID=G8Y429_PICSO|nr:Piso0_005043 [Millerozyma farinosa CBS 7064]